ncbi:MAG TPA: 16S rRNA (cytosine(1402)-N(4))-methyltransferase RsmH [Kiloniellales bacterium]|nr:16S rRNA (cytosine(1402)-N(4))-methyltransferase RsmH [Kiloniellales bacterium]
MSGHLPVMLTEVLQALAPRDGARYLDGTFGRGGYSRALLAAGDTQVLGIDRDPEAVAEGRRLEAETERFRMVEGRFGEMERLVGGFRPLGGIALDLGVSSPQLDEPERGFSFREDGPLDMRMGRDGPSAAEVVNETAEPELADIIWRLGEERRARAVARAIAERRAQQPITRTLELAEIVRSVVRRAADRLDPATRTFQALRLYVNDELGELDRGLAAAERLLAPGGRLAVVSFHSLEDTLVKRFLAERAVDRPQGSRHRPVAVRGDQPTFRLLFKGALKPGAEEIRLNPRAASARLRAAERTAAGAGATA